ncbi:NAD-dependent epimerase/dehydratase family protein [Humidisolicoccus flavus]|uniref:NAD-dependent epimerase/dehydratase family protein n=1 Tax=Humidisolicoccus flavus TaxID=3111414 RepID=UPI00324C385C
MRALVLGGTAWLGREIVRALLARGADVTCLARGESGPTVEGSTLLQADRQQPDAYDGITGDFDAVIELAYEPDLVRSALSALAHRAAHWTLVSSVSVYADNDAPHADEESRLVAPLDLDQYPDAKAAAEIASIDQLGDRLLVARPGLIVGPGDPSDRFGYWPMRLQRGGRVLVPSFDRRFVQVVDVTDLARWIATAASSNRTGIFNVVGNPIPMAQFFEIAATVADFSGVFVTAEDAFLMNEGVNFWAGPRSLPLWLPLDDGGFAQRDNAKFLRSGGSLMPVDKTLARVLQDESERGLDRTRRSGLSRDEESQLLDTVMSQASSGRSSSSARRENLG